MLLFAILICGHFDQLLAEPRTCSKEDFCLPVPAEVCDNSRCLPFDWDEIAVFGEEGMKFNTWNIGQKVLLGYCPSKFKLEQTDNYDGTITEKYVFSLDSGPYCNVTTGYMNFIFNAKQDPYTGKYKILTIDQAGDKYEACFLYMQAGRAHIYRSCRVNPPHDIGKACAAIYAPEIATGNCDKKPFLQLLQSLGIEFQQKVVDCVNEGTIFIEK